MRNGGPARTQRLLSCLGALFGIAFTSGVAHLVLGAAVKTPLLVAPMGASAVLLFAVPESPLAQPWSIMGGNIVSAIVGVTCAQLISTPVFAAATAVALAISLMLALRCVHPPSGAVALTAVLGGPAIHELGYRFVAMPIALQSAALLTAALLFHRSTGHRYPRLNKDRAGPITLLEGIGPGAAEHTFDELTCTDIMSLPHPTAPPTKTDRDCKVHGSTPITELASHFKDHQCEQVWLVDGGGRVVGKVSQLDLIGGLYRQARSPEQIAA